jgi:hypothetical protein
VGERYRYDPTKESIRPVCLGSFNELPTASTDFRFGFVSQQHCFSVSAKGTGKRHLADFDKPKPFRFLVFGFRHPVACTTAKSQRYSAIFHLKVPPAAKLPASERTSFE